MFTRRVRIELKPDSIRELYRKIHNEIKPLPRLQKGFYDGTTSTTRRHTSAVDGARRKTREDAEEYQRTAYPKFLKIISEIAKAPPVCSIFEVLEN